jgi:signal transduction histidine kinase
VTDVLGERVESWVREHELAVDAASAGLLLAGCVLFELIAGGGLVSFVFTLALVLPLVVRRRNPVGCAVAVLLAALVQWLTVRDSVGALPADLAVPMAIAALSAYGPVWASRVGLGAGIAGAVLGGVAWPRLATSGSAHVVLGGFIASTVVAAWAFGTLQRVRREQLAVRDRLAVLAERNRIAREMHDVVAHSLAVLIAQADGGRCAAVASPEAGSAALATIGDYARQALGETRRILGVLRDDPSASEPPPPSPGLEEIPELVRACGLSVELEMPAAGPVPGDVALAAYRIVQEGLTNVLKHAGPAARTRVSVRWSPQELEISVVNDGPSPGGGPSSGYGLLGMRERVAAYGGSVVAGPAPGGGWRVEARIPW